MRSKKVKRVQKGGSFTVNQLMNLFNIFTSNLNYKDTPFPFIEILDVDDDDLYNNIFHVYVLMDKEFKDDEIIELAHELVTLSHNMLNVVTFGNLSDEEYDTNYNKILHALNQKIRIIAIYRGTMSSKGFRTEKDPERFWSTWKDWQNNWRNALFGNTRKGEKDYKWFGNTKRQIKSETGFNKMKQYFEKLDGPIQKFLKHLQNNSEVSDELREHVKNNIDDIDVNYVIGGSNSTNAQKLKIAKKIFVDAVLWYNISTNGSVKEFLKENLTSLGFSQGAVYAYLFGGEGAETIVYNPAPFHGDKPKNTYILKTKNDVVSMFTTLGTLDKKRWHSKKGRWPIFVQSNHENDVLLKGEHKFDVIGKDDKLGDYEQIEDVSGHLKNYKLLKPSIIDTQNPRTQNPRKQKRESVLY